MKVILRGTELDSIKQSKKMLNKIICIFQKKIYIFQEEKTTNIGDSE